MKKIFIREVSALVLISICAIIYFRCGDTGIAPDEPTYCISGTVTNWTQGTRTLQAFIKSPSQISYAIASAPIDTLGNFNICVPLTLPDTSLMNAQSIFTAGCNSGTVTFNPPDVRGNLILSFVVMDGANAIGEIRRTNSDTLYPGAFTIVFLFTNKVAAVTGQKICGSDTLNFNVTAASGWNKISKHCQKVSGTAITYQFNNTEPSGALWKFY